MNEKQIKALIKSIEQIMGNPIEADAREIDALFAEFGDGKAPAQSVFDLASQAAQKYRLEGKTVPIHVTEALNAARRAVSGESLEVANADSVINSFVYSDSWASSRGVLCVSESQGTHAEGC